MNSKTPIRPTFEALQSRLLVFVRTKINNGEYSERSLARLIGISQPQLHNVLKGARRLQPALADRLLSRFEMSLLDLFSCLELEESIAERDTALFQDGSAISFRNAIGSAPFSE